MFQVIYFLTICWKRLMMFSLRKVIHLFKFYNVHKSFAHQKPKQLASTIRHLLIPMKIIFVEFWPNADLRKLTTHYLLIHLKHDLNQKHRHKVHFLTSTKFWLVEWCHIQPTTEWKTLSGWTSLNMLISMDKHRSVVMVSV